MKKILLFMLLTAIICSCNPIPNKPCYETLSLEELTKANKADSNFLVFYEFLQETDIYELSDIEKAKYHEITYSKLYEYCKFFYNEEYWSNAEDIYSAKWNEEYSASIQATDSLIALYKKEKQIAFSEVNKLLSIDLIDLHGFLERYYFPWGASGDLQSKVMISIKCNLSVPQISKVETSLYYWAKDGSNNIQSFFIEPLIDVVDKKNFTFSYNDYYDKFREYYSFYYFTKECDYEFKINKVIIGKDTIVANYPDYKYEYSLIDKRFSKDWMSFSRNKVNSAMITQEDYIEEQIELEKRAFDALCYEVVNEYF